MTHTVNSTTSHVVPVSFHGHELLTTEKDGKVYVAMKPIVEAIGLDWTAQFRRIQRQPVLSQGIAIMATPSAGGEQETTFLPLDLLNGWLFGVDVNRVKPELKERLLQYQKECYHALADYWGKGVAVNTRVTITPEQKSELQQYVKQIGAAKKCYGAIWGRFNNHFKLGSYTELPSAKFDEAMTYLDRLAQEHGLGEYKDRLDKLRDTPGAMLDAALDEFANLGDMSEHGVSGMDAFRYDRQPSKLFAFFSHIMQGMPLAAQALQEYKAMKAKQVKDAKTIDMISTTIEERKKDTMPQPTTA
ncbi:phage antirepressor N-terminal domain-containing protein [Chrysiogenes arsenatis]|uniref:phage antirepressor N-terminal domain-containing protein n=1 Tax=Chrysiogenes arsenatis TaxID=309797 RepID=UPI000400C389|nr:phage antirepressor N-terminal domain-containing protein [Chrysiogenes arsenatis]